LLVVAAEEYIPYRGYLAGYEAVLQSNPKMELLRSGDEQLGPASFGRFVRNSIAKSPVLWPADAVLTVVAALGWTLFRLRSLSEGRQEARRTDGKG
jgi:hypothetical protein